MNDLLHHRGLDLWWPIDGLLRIGFILARVPAIGGPGRWAHPLLYQPSRRNVAWLLTGNGPVGTPENRPASQPTKFGT